MITENVSTLKIHKLTQEQYNRESEAGTLEDNAIYITPDEPTPVAVLTSGSGSAYTATVPAIKSLDVGVSFVMIPHTTSTTASVTLNVNSLGAKQLRRRSSTSTSSPTTGASSNWLGSNKPIRVIYDGTYWVVEGQTKPVASDLNGTLAIAKGGTGATTAAAALTNLGLTATATELNYVDGVTSSIQTQLNNKASTTHSHTLTEFGAMSANNPKGTGSFSLNRRTSTVIGNYSHAEGWSSDASGEASHAEGYLTLASGDYSHAEGAYTTASGKASRAEGYCTTASGDYSHAEGNSLRSALDVCSDLTDDDAIISSYENTTTRFSLAKGKGSHVEGFNCLALNSYSHAEGTFARAFGDSSHAEGRSTRASGDYSHAEGVCTTASGEASHAEGHYTTALLNQHAQGHYNDTTTATEGTSTGTSTGTAFVIGNGSASTRLSNAFRIDYNGTPYAKSALTTTGCDYAEFFEWQDLNPNDDDRRGYFVTLDGDKIKIAEPDDYILGIISGQPSVIGNGDEDWLGRYVFDDFGAFVYEEFEYEDEVPEEVQEEVVDEETGEITIVTKTIMKTVTRTGTRYKENPDYDPSREYNQRADRPEWDAVGMLGVLSVRDDGTCQVNRYCTVTNGGIATASENGYRVIKRVSDNIVKVIFR